MTKSRRQALGAWGEKTAAEFLRGQGYVILAYNLRTPHGELDLITQFEGMIVFVEVKTRATNTFGPPEESVTTRKQTHLLAASQYYMQEHPDLGGSWRIDVISIQYQGARKPPLITHFENALT